MGKIRAGPAIVYIFVWEHLSAERRQSGKRRSGDGVFSTDAPDEPVVMVSLYGALAYCDYLTEVTGLPHRLPNSAFAAAQVEPLFQG